tara:strand:- start:1195 stop:1773 length:579 start_codon:yes stop_codon:yes gene_type:complete
MGKSFNIGKKTTTTGNRQAGKNLPSSQAKRVLDRTAKKRINGKTISRENDKKDYDLMTALKKMKKKGLANFSTIDQNAAAVLDIDPLTADALQLLGAFGITIDTSLDETLDLKQDVTDTETINNPNIQDKNLKNMKNKRVSAKDKFPDTDDSFYKLGSKQRARKQSHDSQLAQELPELAIQMMAASVGGNLN